MGLVVSLILIAAGAILLWAVNAEPEGLDIDVVGVVLIIIGLIGFLLSMLFWSSWGGWGGWGPGARRRTYVESDVGARGYAAPRRDVIVEEPAPRREVIVEEEDSPPAGPPAGPPPP